jgi:hypothetical protein
VISMDAKPLFTKGITKSLGIEYLSALEFLGYISIIPLRSTLIFFPQMVDDNVYYIFFSWVL